MDVSAADKIEIAVDQRTRIRVRREAGFVEVRLVELIGISAGVWSPTKAGFKIPTPKAAELADVLHAITETQGRRPRRSAA